MLPDFILLDLLMPDIQGLEVLKQLRAGEATRSLPVIIFTSQRPERSDAPALAAANAVLMKHELSHESVANVIKRVRVSRQKHEDHHASSA
jgi:CheY-like chemotaxis protein